MHIEELQKIEVSVQSNRASQNNDLSTVLNIEGKELKLNDSIKFCATSSNLISGKNSSKNITSGEFLTVSPKKLEEKIWFKPQNIEIVNTIQDKPSSNSINAKMSRMILKTKTFSTNEMNLTLKKRDTTDFPTNSLKSGTSKRPLGKLLVPKLLDICNYDLQD